MDSPGFDFAQARSRMVDSQVRPNKVADPRILRAMRELPRERFLPPRLRALAYIDEDVPLGAGRVLIEPMVIARLVQLAAPAKGDRALVVACGPGYGSALLAACGARVIALEEDRQLAETARETLQELVPSVDVVTGPLAAGWQAGAPYDIILIEGAVPDIPPPLARQLRLESGRLVGVLSVEGALGHAVLAEATPAGLRPRPVFDCATPVIPALRRKPGFAF